jgi:hypothetical protein
MAKFTNRERTEIESIVTNLTIKRIPDPLIIKHILNQTGHTITRMTLWNIRQRLKKESRKWYSQLREGEYEYLHEFKDDISINYGTKILFIISPCQVTESFFY